MNYKSYFLECGNNSHVNNLIGAKTKDVEGWTQTGLTGGSYEKDGGSFRKDCGYGTLIFLIHIFLVVGVAEKKNHTISGTIFRLCGIGLTQLLESG